MNDILLIKKPSSGEWDCDPAVTICGNQTLKQLVLRIEQGLSEERFEPRSFRFWQTHAKRYDVNNLHLETCDLWILSQYDIYESITQGNYDAILVLQYAPAARVPIAV